MLKNTAIRIVSILLVLTYGVHSAYAQNSKKNIRMSGHELKLRKNLSSKKTGSMLVDAVILCDTSTDSPPSPIPWSVLKSKKLAVSNKISTECGIGFAPNASRLDMYSVDIGATDSFYNSLSNPSSTGWPTSIGSMLDQPVNGQDYKECLAEAVFYVSSYRQWKPGAIRKIIIIGNEALHKGNPQNSDDLVAIDAAINKAKSKNVEVYSWFVGRGGSATNSIITQYKKLASETGGFLMLSGDKSEQEAANMFMYHLPRAMCFTGPKPTGLNDKVDSTRPIQR